MENSVTDDLVLNNVKLINYVINKMGLMESREHFYDVGMIGLVRAAKCFNPDKGVAFSTYGIWCIKNEILKDIRKQKSVHNKANYNTISLDAPVNDDGETELALIDMIADKFDLEEYIIKQEELEHLYKAISKLKPRDRLLLEYTYGPEELTQQEIARRTGLLQGSVSRALRRIYKKLRKIMEGDKNEVQGISKKCDNSIFK